MALRFLNRFRPSLDYPYTSTLNKWSEFCVRKYALRTVHQANGPVVERRRIFCNQWNCVSCGPKRAERLRDEILREADKHGLNVTLDLTLGEAIDVHPANSFRTLKQVWKKFRLSINRQPGKKPEFIWVVGVNEMGVAHLHLLINKRIDQERVSRLWQRCGGGPIVYLQKVRQVLNRADYMACNPLRRGFLRSSRRFGSSKGIKLNVQRLVDDWEVVPDVENIDDLVQGKKVLYSRKDPEGKIVYCVYREPKILRRREEKLKSTR